MTTPAAAPAPPSPPVDAGVDLPFDLGRPQPVIAAFVDVPANVSASLCSRLMIAVVKGKVKTLGEALEVGDVLVVNHPDDVLLEGTGLVVSVIRSEPSSECGVKAKPAMETSVVRAKAAPELRWAKGAMSAHLDVGKTLSPDVYLGRLEGTANVAEHDHAGSWEVVADVEASGTFVIGGVETRVGPRQITFIPPGVKHSYRPDPGTKLVAVQMYSPPGPEQRFIGLAAAEWDAGAPTK